MKLKHYPDTISSPNFASIEKETIKLWQENKVFEQSIIIAAILTPPDVLSQVGLAIPMLILYELSILICRYIEKKKKI